MPRRIILRAGDPVLRTPAEPLAPALVDGPDVRQLVDDLVATLEADELSSLAAPQIGEVAPVLAFRGPAGGVEVVANALIEPEVGGLSFDWEESPCLPGLVGLVPRHEVVRLVGWVPGEGRLERVYRGVVARALQQAYDHLHGVLFLDRMEDLRSLAFREEWSRHRYSGHR